MSPSPCLVFCILRFSHSEKASLPNKRVFLKNVIIIKKMFNVLKPESMVESKKLLVHGSLIESTIEPVISDN